jgi:origin recognition complex subunit 5
VEATSLVPMQPIGALNSAKKDLNCTAIKQKYPCRNQQIDILEKLMNNSEINNSFITIDGSSATGKTSITLALLRHLRLRFAYIDCDEGLRPRALLGSILHQLRKTKHMRPSVFDTISNCEGHAHFLNQLPSVLQGSQGWLLLDNAHRLAGNSTLLTTFARARDACGAKLRFILISSRGWGGSQFVQEGLMLNPIFVTFPAYSPSEINKILQHSFQIQLKEAAKQREEDKLDGYIDSNNSNSNSNTSTQLTDAQFTSAYNAFLVSFVDSVCRASTNLRDIAVAAKDLFAKYIEPLQKGQSLPPAALYTRIRQDVKNTIHNMQSRLTDVFQVAAASNNNNNNNNNNNAVVLGVRTGGSNGSLKHSRGGTGAVNSSGLDFDLPYVSKFLLLAAFIASRNKPTTDAQVFDPGYISGKRKRKNGQAMDRATEAALEAQLRGPHSFPLERLLHMFYCIYQDGDDDFDDDVGNDDEMGNGGGGGGGGGGKGGVTCGDAFGAGRWAKEQALGRSGGASSSAVMRAQSRSVVVGSAHVLMQVTQLCSLRLLEHCGGGSSLEARTYKCLLNEESASAVATNLGISLSDYLRLGQ